MSIQGSDISGIANLLQVHFHWGQNEYQGLVIKFILFNNSK